MKQEEEKKRDLLRADGPAKLHAPAEDMNQEEKKKRDLLRADGPA